MTLSYTKLLSTCFDINCVLNFCNSASIHSALHKMTTCLHKIECQSLLLFSIHFVENSPLVVPLPANQKPSGNFVVPISSSNKDNQNSGPLVVPLPSKLHPSKNSQILPVDLTENNKGIFFKSASIRFISDKHVKI